MQADSNVSHEVTARGRSLARSISAACQFVSDIVDSFPDIFEINQAIFGLRFRKAQCCAFGKKQEQGTHRQTGPRGPVQPCRNADGWAVVFDKAALGAGKKRALHEGRAKKCVSLWGDFLKLDGSFKAVDKRQVHRENDRIYVMRVDGKSKIFRKMRDDACRNVPQFLRVYVAALLQGWYKIPVNPEITPVHTDGTTCRRHKDGIGLVRADEQCRASFCPCCFQWAECLQPMAPAGGIESSK